MILRDADHSADWDDPSDGLDARHYYCQNWRADVAVVIHESTTLVERVMYSPYGVPFGIPCGDLVTNATVAEPADGTVDGADLSKLLSDWGSSHTIADLDNDGDVDGTDLANLNTNWGITLGWGAMSYAHNRFGYAGYVHDGALAGTKWHVRFRVLESVLGRWVSRDPLDYIDGTLLYGYAHGGPIAYVDTFGGLAAPIGVGAGSGGACATGGAATAVLAPAAGAAAVVSVGYVGYCAGAAIAASPAGETFTDWYGDLAADIHIAMRDVACKVIEKATARIRPISPRNPRKGQKCSNRVLQRWTELVDAYCHGPKIGCNPSGIGETYESCLTKKHLAELCAHYRRMRQRICFTPAAKGWQEHWDEAQRIDTQVIPRCEACLNRLRPGHLREP